VDFSHKQLISGFGDLGFDEMRFGELVFSEMGGHRSKNDVISCLHYV